MIDPEVIVQIRNNRIQYLGHAPGAGKLIKLRNGHKVDECFYINVVAEVVSILNGMEIEKNYTTRDMCGDDFWQSISRWNRNIAGMCVADAVKRRWLPLIFKKKKRKDQSTLKYKIKPQNSPVNNEEV